MVILEYKVIFEYWKKSVLADLIGSKALFIIQTSVVDYM